MSQKFQTAVHQRDDVSYVKVSGVIDEDNELAELTDRVFGSTVVIDLGEVERINSCGVRDWVNWLGKVDVAQRTGEVVFVECSPSIVAQINLVNNFTGSGVVKSFYIPYFCPECDGEKVLLTEVSDMSGPPYEPPTCRCDECDLVMDFDDMPDSYFAFLSNQKKVAKPERIQAVIEELGVHDGEKSKIRSRVGSAGHISSPPSLPSVPSLPSISRQHLTGPGGLIPGSSPGTGPGIRQSNPSFGGITPAPVFAPQAGPASSPQAKGGVAMYLVISVLVAAIGVLIYLLVAH
ncbi:MAG TPA: hypothetical protein VFG83_10785 [Kofleriaceae bacterium]|nr:hypothetical protein [Kofleriaceae bacterium]